MKYKLMDGYDKDKVWIFKNKNDLISHLLGIIGDMTLEVEE